MMTALPAPVQHLLRAADPVLHIHGLDGRRWSRHVPEKDARFGPWLQARYDVLNAPSWQHRGPCLYFVTGADEGLRYVGISRNGLKHRWRLSPGVDSSDGASLPQRQLFHSQCWKHVEVEFAQDPQAHFTVHSLGAQSLIEALAGIDDPLASLATLSDDAETVAMAVERWICNRASASVASWNVAMTGRR
jgi:hypothetical protein